MFARLWWKEARQVWPAWAFLACVGLALHGLARWLAGPGPADGYLLIAGVVTVIYLFLIAAAAFAGEREDGTLGLLDAMPVERSRLWAAKASFALVTTLALGTLLWLSSLACAGLVAGLGRSTAAAVVWGSVALGWGLLWSALLGTAMGAAVLAMASLGATLAALTPLQHGPTTEAAPALLAVALATAAASAFAFVRMGPPRWERRRPRPPIQAAERPDSLSAPAAAESFATAEDRRLARVWPYSVGRLAWETWRRIRADLKMLLAVAVGATIYARLTEWDRGQLDVPGLFLVMTILGLMTGVATFNGDNRGRTHRFLNQHAARPSVVWGVKLAMWWLATAALCLVVASPVLYRNSAGLGLADLARPPVRREALTILGGLTIPFAVGALCGMVFRRAIMAGAMAVVVMIVMAASLGFPLSLGLMTSAALMYVPLALLFATWAWSGDWLRFPPGVGKWSRLALWCVAAAAALVPGYIARRAWDAPRLPEAQARALFQPERFDHPAPPDENAAPLYEEAARLVQLSDVGTSGPEGPTNRVIELLNAPPPAPEVAAWLEKVEPALKLLREGARRPYCAYQDVRKTAVLFGAPREPYELNLTAPLIYSIRARLDRGDPDGAWDDVETLLRMARQYSRVRSWSYFNIERRAVAEALTWAADARLKAGSLERALASYRSLPPGATPADRLRADRLVFQNAMDLPSADLIDMILGVGRRRVGVEEALRARAMTTPWEVARARRVHDLLAATWIESFGDKPYNQPSVGSYLVGSARVPDHGLLIEQAGDGARRIDAERLAALATSTPLVQLATPGWESPRHIRVETDRRALALVLRLRLYQARHDGELPGSLDELPPAPDGAADRGLIDPYGGGRFGYIESSGQRLYSIKDAAFQGIQRPPGTPEITAESGEYRLLYSVGPDLQDVRAARPLDMLEAGDIVYPLRDRVKPPPAESSP